MISHDNFRLQLFNTIYDVKLLLHIYLPFPFLGTRVSRRDDRTFGVEFSSVLSKEFMRHGRI